MLTVLLLVAVAAFIVTIASASIGPALDRGALADHPGPAAKLAAGEVRCGQAALRHAPTLWVVTDNSSKP